MDMEPRLNVVTLAVSDLARARKFYESGFGWKVSLESQGDIVFFQLGGVVLALYSRDLLAADANVSPNGAGFRGVTLAHNVREKSDVAKILEDARAAGAKIVRPAQDALWGGHSGYFADLDGHLWEVAWNPQFRLNERGEVGLP
jgi:catechol 2,3-dioxygenase-like lactoylglutathione lyase family enzyme